MSSQKKFGTFAGVFTPSLLTILGVIMYMRLGWVVGNAGLAGMILIIVIAHVISISTGLSISSIATDKKVGPGGVYYVLSRSLGLPIGGAIGMTLFVGTALSISLYLIGFAESFNAYFGLVSDINGLRIGGSLALLVLTTLAFISTSLALKAQFFILAAIVLSLVSIVLGTSPAPPSTLPLFGTEGSASMEQIFAIFFPAVTGFTAGIAMSGDLKDPKKSIPMGTLLAIAVGFLVYIGLALYIFYSVDAAVLKTDNNVLLKMALFAPAVVAGIWGATLSSALGGILGGPRILQAMSVDKITPRRFAIGVGKGNEPQQALLLTVLIAEGGILIGELDTIARVCSMFYLAAYGFINLSFFLESWASSDFNPTFKIKRWIGLLGFIATFMVMFRLDMVAMIAAFIVIGGIYVWLTRKELALGSGDIWRSVWSSVVKTGLRRMDAQEEHKRNWKPNVLLFSGGTDHRPYLLEFSKELVGNRGIVTNFDLVENQEAAVLFPKHKQSVSDEVLKRYGAFGRQIEVKNVFKGIETIASTFGFSGIEPNTILMGWAKNTKDPIWFAQMTQKLIDLDYNVLYLDYDERFGFRKYAEIDLWWRGVGNNAELMLNISKFLLASELWRNAQVRIFLVDDTNSNKKIKEKKIQNLLQESRMTATIKIISNAVERQPLYGLMKTHSSEADLILVGIPKINMKEVQDFVSTTNDLVKTIGTTLLVKASTQFDDIDFQTTDTLIASNIEHYGKRLSELPQKAEVHSEDLRAELDLLEDALHVAAMPLMEHPIGSIQEKYGGFYQSTISALKSIDNAEGTDHVIFEAFSKFLEKLQSNFQQIRTTEIPVLHEIFTEETRHFVDAIEALVKAVPTRLNVGINGEKKIVKFRKAVQLLQDQTLIPSIRDTYLDLGNKCYENLSKTKNELLAKTHLFFEVKGFFQEKKPLKNKLEAFISDLTQLMQDQQVFFQDLTAQFELELLKANRDFYNELASLAQQENFPKAFTELKRTQDHKTRKTGYSELLSFPDNWSSNQRIIHTALENDLKMAAANLLVNKGLRSLSQSIATEVNYNIEKLFKEHVRTIQNLIQKSEAADPKKPLDNIIAEEKAFPGMEVLMQQLIPSIDGISNLFQEDALLMPKSLVDDFDRYQLERMAPITLDLPKIVDFIIETKLNGPVQQLLERYLGEASNFYVNYANRINLLTYSLSEAKNDKEVSLLLERVQARFLDENEQFEATKAKFNAALRNISYDLQRELDTYYVADHAENWSRYIRASKRKKGIAQVPGQVKAKLSEWYHRVASTIAAKQHESAISVFELKYNLKNNVEIGLNFVRAMSPPKTVLESLPFYYKQLFHGKHLPVQRKYIGRARELQLLDKAIAEGKKGAILVSGKSASGKTHFSEYIADIKLKGRVFKIDAIGKQGTLKELQRSFAAATGNTGDLEQCFAALPRNSVLLLNDIEVWWDRSLEKDALAVLIAMLDKYQHKHTFVLNTNLHAFESLSNLGLLRKIVTTTIVLTPASKEELKAIILERHKVGGLDIEIAGEENRLEGKAFNRLLDKIYTESGGNIGLGLQIWLRQISAFSNNKIVMETRPSLEILKVGDARWKWVLYQFLINKNLSKSKIEALFGADSAEELMAVFPELVKAEILDEVGRNIFTLNSVVKPNIEIWLAHNNVL